MLLLNTSLCESGRPDRAIRTQDTESGGLGEDVEVPLSGTHPAAVHLDQDREDLSVEWLGLGLGAEPGRRIVDIDDRYLVSPVDPMTRETSAPWSSDRELDLDEVAEILGEQFPDLSGQPLRFLQAGWDSEAFEVDERWIFRFPKRQDVVEHLETEILVLPLLASRLPIPVPRPRFHGEPSARFPYPFMGYPKISGVPLDELPASALRTDAILEAVVEFLEALHAMPLEGPIAQVRGWPAGEELEARILRLGLSEEPLVVSSLRRLGTEGSPAPVSRLVHDDLGIEHVLIDPQSSEVTGIIDWGDLNIGDPASDFVGLLEWVGLERLRQVVERSTYPADPALLERAVHGFIRNHLFSWCDGIEYDVRGMRSGSRKALSEWVVA